MAWYIASADRDQGGGETFTSVDGPWESDFARTAAASDLTAIVELVVQGETVMDRGTDPDTGEMASDGGDGVPVTVGTYRVVEVISGEGAVSGEEITVVVTELDHHDRSDAARAGVAEATSLLVALDRAAEGSSYLVDGDYYTPIGADNGVVAVIDGELRPWDARVDTIDGAAVDGLSLSEATSSLERLAAAD
ncbi:MAG: hypothetical protein ACK4MD_01560 [Demequina sp.]